MRKFVSHYSDKIMTQDTIGRITADTTIDYGNLMRRRIRKVLLIGSSYDAFTLERTAGSTCRSATSTSI